jgi:archaellum component FlaC
LVLITLKNDVKSLKEGASNLKTDLKGMQNEIKKLGDILVNLADIRGEIRVLDTRLTSAEQDVRELRHGQGFVQGPRGIDREY